MRATVRWSLISAAYGLLTSHRNGILSAWRNEANVKENQAITWTQGGCWNQLRGVWLLVAEKDVIISNHLNIGCVTQPELFPPTQSVSLKRILVSKIG